MSETKTIDELEAEIRRLRNLNQRREWTLEDDRRLEQLTDQGFTGFQIANKLDRTRVAIYNRRHTLKSRL